MKEKFSHIHRPPSSKPGGVWVGLELVVSGDRVGGTWNAMQVCKNKRIFWAVFSLFK